ncbi:TPA: hypothetical protein WGQ52_000578 [Neisseria meningitidis]
MKHFQSKVLTAAILAALSGSAMAAESYEKSEVDNKITAVKTELETKLTAQDENRKEDIKKIRTFLKELLGGKQGNEPQPGLIDTIDEINTSLESNKSKYR